MSERKLNILMLIVFVFLIVFGVKGYQSSQQNKEFNKFFKLDCESKGGAIVSIPKYRGYDHLQCFNPKCVIDLDSFKIKQKDE